MKIKNLSKNGTQREEERKKCLRRRHKQACGQDLSVCFFLFWNETAKSSLTSTICAWCILAWQVFLASNTRARKWSKTERERERERERTQTRWTTNKMTVWRRWLTRLRGRSGSQEKKTDCIISNQHSNWDALEVWSTSQAQANLLICGHQTQLVRNSTKISPQTLFPSDVCVSVSNGVRSLKWKKGIHVNMNLSSNTASA